MTSPNTLNLIQYTADHALLQAKELEEEAAELEKKARLLHGQADCLRNLHEVAKPFAKASTLEVER